MKFIVAFIVSIGIIVAIVVSQQGKAISLVSSPSPVATVSAAPVHYVAHFAIFTNGTFRDFSDSKYHNQSQDVYLKAVNPNEVHVNTSAITWQNFFDTLPMKITKECLTTGTNQVFCTNETSELKFFINGQENQNALDEVISVNSKLLVSFGAKDRDFSSELERLRGLNN